MLFNIDQAAILEKLNKMKLPTESVKEFYLFTSLYQAVKDSYQLDLDDELYAYYVTLFGRGG